MSSDDFATGIAAGYYGTAAMTSSIISSLLTAGAAVGVMDLVEAGISNKAVLVPTVFAGASVAFLKGAAVVGRLAAELYMGDDVWENMSKTSVGKTLMSINDKLGVFRLPVAAVATLAVAAVGTVVGTTLLPIGAGLAATATGLVAAAANIAALSAMEGLGDVEQPTSDMGSRLRSRRAERATQEPTEPAVDMSAPRRVGPR